MLLFLNVFIAAQAPPHCRPLAGPVPFARALGGTQKLHNFRGNPCPLIRAEMAACPSATFAGRPPCNRA